MAMCCKNKQKNQKLFSTWIVTEILLALQKSTKPSECSWLPSCKFLGPGFWILTKRGISQPVRGLPCPNLIEVIKQPIGQGSIYLNKSGTICWKAEEVAWWMEPLGSFPRVLNVLPRKKIEGPPRYFLKAYRKSQRGPSIFFGGSTFKRFTFWGVGGQHQFEVYILIFFVPFSKLLSLKLLSLKF